MRTVQLNRGASAFAGTEPRFKVPAIAAQCHPPVVWQVDKGDIHVQVHRPEHARQLSRMKGVRLVAWSVSGPYLRIFGADKPPRWGRNVIAKLMGTYCRSVGPDARQSDDSGANGSGQRPARSGASTGRIAVKTALAA